MSELIPGEPMSLRYVVGYSLLLLPRLWRTIIEKTFRLVSLPEQFALIIWNTREIDRYARADWNRSSTVRGYASSDEWLGETEQTLLEKYFTQKGELLNLACGAGREALPLARRGLRVTACDWSPRMIAEAQRRAREANLSIRFEIADVYDLLYPENAFDYLLLTNIAYSYLFPRHRRVRFLRQAHSALKPGGLFILSFARADDESSVRRGLLERLLLKLRQWPPCNKEYEPGDRLMGTFHHFFEAEDLKQEFEEAKFIMKEWLWDRGYAVLAKE